MKTNFGNKIGWLLLLIAIACGLAGIEHLIHQLTEYDPWWLSLTAIGVWYFFDEIKLAACLLQNKLRRG